MDGNILFSIKEGHTLEKTAFEVVFFALCRYFDGIMINSTGFKKYD